MNQLHEQNLIPHFILDQHQQGNDRGNFLAATLFVDLSGFTPLTATLMQHGKDGAEVLAVALREIFTPLVHAIYVHGGFIPLFAGDAFTAIYPVRRSNHSEAAQRALASAQMIQQRLRGEGRSVATPYGTFAISATAGLSFGSVEWGIPGTGPTRAFYFRGPAIDGCAEAEHRAADGEVVVDQKILALIDTVQFKMTALTEPDYARVDGFGDAAINAAPLTPTPTISQLQPFVPQSILQLAAGASPAEFREVCVLFLSLQECELEELHRFLTTAMQLTVEYGGIVNQLDFGDMGGYLLMLFGAPVGHEDDPVRAAAFLMALREKAFAVPWRAGLDYGTVWAGIRGGEERCEYGVAGNVVILACRLFLMAPWGEIWISEAVAEPLQARYELVDLGRKPIKGRSKPQPVYRMVGTRHMLADMAPRAGFVGRTEELAQLQHWVQPIFAGHFAGIIYIDGEAGIGKSRLVSELQHTLIDDHDLLWLECPADAMLGQSLHPFRHALRTCFGSPNYADATQNRQHFDATLDRLIDQLSGQPSTDDSTTQQRADLAVELDRVRSVLAALLNIHWPDSFYAQLEPQLRFENTLAALKTFIKALAVQQPVILHLADTHWLDEDSAQMVQLLTRNLSDTPLVILATGRPLNDDRPFRLPVGEEVPQQALSLSYLTTDGIRAHAAQILGGDLIDESVQDLMQRTNGNPFLIEQLVLHLREQGQLTADVIDGRTRYVLGDDAAGTVPPTLNAVLVARLDRLEPALKQVVQTAAVLGSEFEVPILAHMLEQDHSLQQQLSAAQQEQIWSALTAVRYLFRHALLRDAAYDMQMRTRLRGLHERAGQAIELVHANALEPHYANLAYHYDQARQIDSAIQWYGLAGEYAAAQYANADAVRYYSRALALTPEVDATATTRYQLLVGREAVYDLLGQREPQLRDIDRLAALAVMLQDESKQSAIALRRTAFALATGSYHKAAKHAEQAVLFAKRAGDGLAEARAYHRWGRAFWQAGEYDAAKLRIEQALQLASSHHGIVEQADCYYDLAANNYYQRAFSTALKYVKRALSIYETIQHKRGQIYCLSLSAILMNELGEHSTAMIQFDHVLQLCREAGSLYSEARILALSGNNYLNLGYLEESRQCHQQAIALYQETDDREGIGTSQDSLGLLCSFLGNYTEAQRHFQAALSMHRKTNNLRGEAYVLTHFGYLLLKLRQPLRATGMFDRALSLRQERNEGGLVIDTLAGSALAALETADEEKALLATKDILAWIALHGDEGIEFPDQVYFCCYRVLSTLVITEPAYQAQAADVLERGYRFVIARVAQIKDEPTQRQFTQTIPFRRELAAEWQMIEKHNTLANADPRFQ